MPSGYHCPKSRWVNLLQIKTQLWPRLEGQASVLAGAWLAALITTLAVYWPGLHGPFLLDDFDALSALGKFGGVRDWESFKAFIFGGQAGPTGRPLALLSFLIDANNWPAESFAFKRTNLIIHLLNGVLLGVFISQILKTLGKDNEKSRWVVFAATVAWMLHPFLVSTNLYVVQRMAQLAALFMLGGLVLYVQARNLLPDSPRKAYLMMSAAIGVFTPLAMISKENGILLPLLIGVVEITVFASRGRELPTLSKLWSGIFLVLPTAVIGAYLIYRAADGNFFNAVLPREFSTWERLLTEARILVDYLKNWFVPQLYTAGVFQDHFVKSTGILNPVATLVSILFHVSAIVLAIAKRKQWPVFALAVLFFYANHVLESTVIDLELYFEHRNYLAAGLLFLPLFLLLAERASSATFLLATVAILAILGGFTRYSAGVWSDHRSMIELAALTVPKSVRAQGQFATILHDTGQSEAALQVLDRAIETIPSDHPLLLVTKLNVLCSNGQLTADEFRNIAEPLSRRFYDARTLRLYMELMSLVTENRCPEVSAAHLREMFRNMLATEPNSDPDSLAYSQIQYFVGYTYVAEGDSGAAVKAFRDSLRAEPGASPAMAMAALLASNGHFEEALEISNIGLAQLDEDRSLRAGQSLVNRDQILGFQQVVRDDIRNRDSVGTGRPKP